MLKLFFRSQELLSPLLNYCNTRQFTIAIELSSKTIFHCVVGVVCIDVAQMETSQICHAICEVLLVLVGSTVKSHESIWILTVLCKCLFSLHILTLWKGKLKIKERKLFCITHCNLLAISTNINALLLLNLIIMTWHK